MKLLTFGYGSNMLLRKLKINVPSAVKVTNAVLNGYRFSFNKISLKDGSGKGNIVKTDNIDDKVHGVVFELDANDKTALDREEGLGRGHNETLITVFDDIQAAIQTSVYIANESIATDDLLMPYDWYRDMVIVGAIENEIDRLYIDFLKSFNYLQDQDLIRRKSKYAIIHPPK